MEDKKRTCVTDIYGISLFSPEYYKQGYAARSTRFVFMCNVTTQIQKKCSLHHDTFVILSLLSLPADAFA